MKNHQHTHSFLTVITLLVSLFPITSFAQASRYTMEAGICGECIGLGSGSTNQIKVVANDAKKVLDFLPPEIEKRTIKDRFENPEYNGIGIVKSSIGAGTGFLINKCLVMTNKHVIDEKHKYVIGKSVEFYVGQTSVDSRYNFKYADLGGVVVASGNQDRKRDYDKVTDDWAIIKLNKNIANEISPIEVAFTDQNDLDNNLNVCSSIEIAGFPGEKPRKHLWWEGDCKYISQRSNSLALALNCPVTKGNSGSPVLCRTRDTNEILAIGIATQKGSTETSSVSLNLEGQKEFIEKAIRENPCN